MTPAELFAAAVDKIEAPGTKAWATSDHNRPILLEIAAGAIAKADREHRPPPDACRFGAYIVCLALGL